MLRKARDEQMNEHLINIEKAAEIFGKSVRIMRDYKRLLIIQPVAKDGMKDLYDPSDTRWASDRLKELVLNLSLKDSADIIVRERRKNKK